MIKLSDNQKVRVSFIAQKELKTGKAIAFEVAHEILTKKKSKFSSDFLGPKSQVTIQDSHVILPMWLAKKWQQEAMEKEKNEVSEGGEVKDF